jgi:hypothetical protein
MGGRVVQLAGAVAGAGISPRQATTAPIGTSPRARAASASSNAASMKGDGFMISLPVTFHSQGHKGFDSYPRGKASAI